MKRRDFLKNVGLIGAGAAMTDFTAIAAPASPKSEEEKMPLLKGLNEGIRGLEPLIGDKTLSVAIVGCGNRGKVYERFCHMYSDRVKVVAISDINPDRNKWMADRWNLPENRRFGDFHEILAAGKIADAMFICLPDALHYEPAMKAMELGYDVLLEKPLAQTGKECQNLLAQSRKYNNIIGTCHVLRYAPYFIALKNAIQKGLIGDIVSVQHMEPIAFHHMAHSYVRGNWHNSKETTPIILAKSCHDLDIIRWLVDKPCTGVSAEGSLRLFKAENAPAGAPLRCTDGCPHDGKCPFSALDIYARRKTWLKVFDMDSKTSYEDIVGKLKTTDYGKCVYHCDNDQPDHYVANLTFEGGITAAFSMEAFTPWGGRRTRVMGTKGYIEGDGTSFTLWDFATRKANRWFLQVEEVPEYKGSGHGGGDLALARDFVEAAAFHDSSRLKSTIEASVESHLMGFNCEKSRLKGVKVKM